MKTTILTSILFAGILLQANSQSLGTSYTTAIGVKVYPASLSVKHFVQQNNAIEGLLAFWESGNRLTGLYEIHGDINNAEGLKWYIGPGAHIGSWNDTWKKNNPTRESGMVVGVDGILGLDFKFKNVPLNMSIDWQPSFNLIGYQYFESGWGGLGIRYTL